MLVRRVVVAFLIVLGLAGVGRAEDDGGSLADLSFDELLDEDALYPMTSLPGDAALSPGTPALESRTFWVTATIAF